MKHFLFGALFSTSLLALGQSVLPERIEYQLLEDIRNHYGTGDWQLVAELSKEYRQHFSRSTEEVNSRNISAQLEMGQEQYSPEAERFIEKHTFSTHTARVKISLGNFLLRRGEYSRALEAYQQVEASRVSRKSYAPVVYGMGICEFEQGHYDEALTHFELVLGDPGYADEVSFFVGYIHYGRGDFAKALVYLETVEERREVIPMVANSYAQLGKKERVIEYAKTRLPSSDKDVKAVLYRLLGDAYFEAGDFRETIKHHGQTVRLSLVDATVHYKLGFAYESTEDGDRAIEQYKIAALEDSEVGQLSAYRLGYLYLEQGDYEYASQSFQAVSSKHYSSELSRNALFLAGKIKVELEQYDEAITMLQRWLEMYPQSDGSEEASDLLAESWLRTSNYDKVIGYVEMQQNPTSISRSAYQKATFFKGLSYFNQEEFDAALRYLSKSFRFVENEALYTEGLHWYGECHIALEQPERAREYLQQSASRKGETFHLSQYALGYLDFEEEDYESAIRYFQSLRSLEATHPFWLDAAIREADCRFMLESFDLARKAYLELVPFGKQTDYLMYQLGWIDYHTGDLENSKINFEKVVATGNELADDAMFQIGQMQFEQSRFSNAAQTFLNLTQDFPGSELLPAAKLKRGLSLSNTGELENAKLQFIEVVQAYPQDVEARDAVLGLQELEKKGHSVVQLDEIIDFYKQANPEDGSLEAIDFERIKSIYFAGEYTRLPLYIADFQRDHPKSNFIPDMLYYLADGYYQQEQYELATGAFEPLLELQQFDYHSRVLDKNGRALLHLEAFNESLRNYHLLLRRAQNGKETYLGLEGLMLTHRGLGSDSVLYYGNRLLDGPWLPLNGARSAQLTMMEHQAENDRWQLVVQMARELEPRGDTYDAQALLLAAQAKSNLTDFEGSNDMLFDLISRHAEEEVTVGKAYLLLVDNYLALEEVLQAEATNESILANATDTFLLEAATAKSLDILAEKQKLVKLSADTLLTEPLDTLR